MRKNTLLAFLGILVFSLIKLAPLASAAEFNFGVYTVIPDNQIDKQKSYFNLRMEPNQKQTLTIQLKNDTAADVVIEPKIHSTTTNINGVVEYGPTKDERDSSLPHELGDLIKTDEEITIPAKGSKDLHLHVTMPEEEFTGILAGGITLEEKKASSKNMQETKEGLSIENKYSYVVGITLQENDEKVKQDLKLHDVKAGQVNARNVIHATLQNPTAAYLNQFELDAKITEKGKDKELYTSKKQGMQMAPNSNFDYPIPLNGEKMQPGTYTLHLKAKSTEESWDFTKDFTIKGEEAKQLNEKDVSIEGPNYEWYIVGILFILLAGLLWFLLWRRKKKKQEQESND
ncbi:cell wall anchor protein [Bacillus sp. SRB_28]|nr:cell wall anchor protein [Bacillus sp. SRB_28]